jgi:hypothetical protein
MARFLTQPFARVPVRWRRPLAWGLGVLLVLEVLYNAVLVTGLLATVLNHFTHERPRVEWHRAWSLIPGCVHVRGFTLRQQEPSGSYWQLEMDTVKVNISLLALFKKQLRTESLEVQGLQVHLHPGTREATQPRSPPPDNPWKLLLHGIQVHDVHDVEWGNSRLTGITEATGVLELVPGHRVTVKEGRVQLGPGLLAYEAEVLAHLEHGSAEFSLEARRQEPGGIDLVAGLTEGRFQLTGTYPSFSELPRLTSRLDGLSLRGGSGHLDLDLHVKNGQLAPGTEIRGTSEPIALGVGPLRLKAPWRLHSDVYTEKDGGDRLGLKLELGPAHLEGGEWPKVDTSEVRVLLGAKAPRLGHFPRDAQLEVHTEPLHATWGGATMKGVVSAEVDARKLSVKRGSMALPGSQVELKDISVQTPDDTARGWDGSLTFPDASLALSPPSAEGHFEGSFTSAAPFVALLTFKGGLPHVLAPLLKADNLHISGAVVLGKQGVQLSHLRAKGEGLELRGQAETTGGPPHAVFLVKMGILPVGVEAGEGDTHVQILNPGDWYEKQTGESSD